MAAAVSVAVNVPSGLSYQVTISDPAGDQVFSDAGLSSAVSMPATVAATTQFYVPANGASWTVAVSFGGVALQSSSFTADATAAVLGVSVAPTPTSAHLAKLLPSAGLSATYAHWDGSQLTQGGSPVPVTGGVNTSDVGYDVILIAGQSNASGGAAPADATHYDAIDGRIWQFAQSGTEIGKICLASEPMAHPDSTTAVGPVLSFAREHVCRLPSNRRVLIVPRGYGGTALVGGVWDPDTPGAQYSGTIAGANAAMAAAGANARLVAIIWIQGEGDSAANVTGANYSTKLATLIAGFRSGITGASATTPFIIGSMVPEWVNAPNGTSLQISAAHAAVPSTIAHTAYVGGPTGHSTGTGGIHYDQAGSRILGRSLYDGLAVAVANTLAPTLPGQVTGVLTTVGSTQISLSWTAPTSIGTPITDYVIQYKRSIDSVWTTFADGTSTGTTALVTGLTNSTAYDFRVAAVNSVGQGAYSATISATPLASATYTAAVLADTPAVYLLLGESSGTVAADSSGNSRAGAYVGTPTLGATGLTVNDASTGDKCLTVASGKYAKITAGSWMNASLGALTAEAIFKTPASSPTTAVVFSYDDANTQRSWFMAWNASDMLLNVNAKIAGTFRVAADTTPLAPSTVYHVAFTYDGTTLKLYKNGSLVGSAAFSGTVASITQDMQIGALTGASWYLTGGEVEKYAFYPTALSAGRILAHYNATLT